MPGTGPGSTAVFRRTPECISKRSLALPVASKIRRRAAFRLAAGDEFLQRGAALRLQRRRDELGEAGLVESLGGVVGGRRAGLAPSLVIAPVGDHRREKGVAIARLRVRGAEEMAARANLLHRLER